MPSAFDWTSSVAAVCLSLSVVSHGHGAAVFNLLEQLAALDQPQPTRVLLTLNQAEPWLAAQVRGRTWPFELVVLENPAPLGFGANHNRAFACDRRMATRADVFAVINPDVTLHGNPFAPLLTALAAPRVGCAYPLQLDAAGTPQDHERRLPTPTRLLRRVIARALGRQHAEVVSGQSPDWVSAAFLVLRADAYVSVGGFDESYHMYCEDVDLSLRLQLAGWQLRGVPRAVVEHAAQRASRRQPRHLAWHVRSLLRLWRSPAYASFRRRRLDDGSSL